MRDVSGDSVLKAERRGKVAVKLAGNFTMESMETAKLAIGPGKPSAIESLPPDIRQKCIDLLLSDEPGSTKQVCQLSGVSRQAVSNYRKRHLRPALQTAAKVLENQHVDRATNDGIVATAKLTRDIVKASPVTQRLESLWKRTETALDRAESAIKVVRDPETGEMRSNGPDVAAMAPLLAQAHANIKLLGELTGELGSTATGPQVAIQIVCPAGTAPGSVQVKHVPLATGEADEPVIDIMPDRE